MRGRNSPALLVPALVLLWGQALAGSIDAASNTRDAANVNATLQGGSDDESALSADPASLSDTYLTGGTAAVSAGAPGNTLYDDLCCGSRALAASPAAHPRADTAVGTDVRKAAVAAPSAAHPRVGTTANAQARDAHPGPARIFDITRIFTRGALALLAGAIALLGYRRIRRRPARRFR